MTASREIQARKIAYLDPGIPIEVLIFRLAGDKVPADQERQEISAIVADLVESGWLREVRKDVGGGQTSCRLYLSVPFCRCGDSVYTGYRCPDESTQNTWPSHGIEDCPARKKAGIAHG